MKIGISLKLDVTKIDKSRLFKSEKGATYLDLTTFIDTDNEGQYGDHGFITQSKKKEEGKDVQLPILGNTKVFWQEAPQFGQQAPASPLPSYDDVATDDTCPF